MACDRCGSPVVHFETGPWRQYAPDEALVATICTVCLSVEEALEDVSAVDDTPDFSAISDAFPQNETAVPLCLLLSCCRSLALNRAAIEALLAEIERTGTDPLLVVDRLVRDPDLEPAIDLERRRTNLEAMF